MNALKHLMAAAIICLTPSLASADTFNLVDYGNYTVDLNSGLQWLDISSTKGKSFNQVSSMLGSGGSLEGWRFATVDEFQGIFSSRGYAFSGSTTQNMSTGNLSDQPFFQHLIGLMGPTVTNGNANSIFGILGTDFANSSYQYMGQIYSFYDSSESFAKFQQGPLDTATNNAVGSYLVQNVSPVPAPSTWILMLTGLGLLIMSTRYTNRHAVHESGMAGLA